MSDGGRLAGKTAVVVGAGQTPGETVGNGRATALTFAREGARVFAVDRDRESLDETVAMIREAGGEVTAHVASIGPEEVCRRMIEAAHAALGRIDILHNNVGIGAGDAGVSSLEERAWDRIMDVNLKAMWLTCKHVLPVMRDQRAGAIVNISSIAAIEVPGNLVAYKISKAGVNALTQSLAASNARFNIRANAIMPGLMDTPMAVDAAARASGRTRDEIAAARAAVVPLGHQGTAWDVANAALFLASDESAFVTGVLLSVDGGQSL
ncbi:MAG TPA: SDR family NAD(P)-dependent oxidoreductase [Acidimicrobiales bacterium]|nr:SDR family NAD(P)-dependent oxidoreductase [Acidimicrobiales bacterium]